MLSTILLIDDSPGECELLRQALTQAGYQGRLEVTHDHLGALTQLNLPPEAANRRSLCSTLNCRANAVSMC